ncbi:DUF2634 domain-containing protein [Paenibacillus alvei]|uniref:DUF2634 domain-containing protein n=1 Tax=Paenibacillus alvei TaxID=44250 RepID=UPI000289C4CF|nr:DUF2634 domain-containing protein [Paenibacillus alvei]EJW14856.1 hypothetical protein PAV_11c01970 [Paenibacillus alvei DSM 29]MCY9544721.1 DUF2634 domain-containing protein [Paenibacillus alvei]MCY9708375.1 DUF2634 domain-containing protein [Paenibacillus alvei]MEC0083259.1 DUF2634 domain-containing protein [Paenibacillus alvei]
MSVFPFIFPEPEAIEEANSLPICKEYAFNFERGEFELRNGKQFVVTELPAVLIKVRKALMTERYIYEMYSFAYGVDYTSLIGNSFSRQATNAEAERYTREALEGIPWVTGIREFEAALIKDKLHISFVLETVYGNEGVTL